ncbi:MAG: rhodanese-like domain-containing protein [Opitutales bacterium]
MHRALRELGLLLLLAAVPALVAARWHPRRPGLATADVPSLSVTAAQSLAANQPVLWIDARREPDFAHAHIPGALQLNEDAWETLLPAVVAVWRPGQTVIVYCDTQSCNASREVAARLQRELPMKPVYVLEGGWAAWQRAPARTH